MIQRLTHLAAAVMLLSALAASAGAEGRAQSKNQGYAKDGCCADACAKECSDGEETSPACTDACNNPCTNAKPAGSECCENSCGSGCKKVDSCGNCCSVAVKIARGCNACCTAASRACSACCKGEGACAKKETSGCCAGKGCCAEAAKSCCACCKAAAVSVAEACCACCKGECPCSKKETAVSCPSCAASKGCCSASKACCACCKAGAVSIAESCSACCKGECACSKKVSESACKCCPECCSGAAKKAGGCRGACPKKAKPEEVKPPVAPVFTPAMMVPHVPGTPPVSFYPTPIVPPGPCGAPPVGSFVHSTFNAPVPCPGMPMPCPNAGYVGCPMPCSASPYGCPVPQPVAAAMTTASAPCAAEYEVCVKIVDCKAGREDKVVVLPQLRVEEGQPGTCTVVGLGRMRVRVDHAEAGKVSLNVRLSRHNICCGAEGSVSLCQSCSAVRTARPGEAVRVALCKSCEESACGKSGKWVEIVVRDCDPRGEKKKACVMAPAAKYGRQPASMPPAVCVPMPAPMPPAVYAPHPTPYVPPSPPVTARECAVVSPIASCGSCVDVTEIVPCTATESKCNEPAGRVFSVASDGSLQYRDGDCTVRGTSVTVSVKGTTLTLRSDEMKGRKRVCVEAECDLEAVADTMTVEADGRLVLEGEVKILCASPTSGMAERVEAGCVILELEAGKMKCFKVVHDRP